MNPRRPKEHKTPSKILGTATHRLLLDGREAFNADYVRGPYGPDDDHLSSADKSALTKKAKTKLMEGQELLSQEDYDFVLGCKEVLDIDPKLRGCLDNGLSEVSVFWTRNGWGSCQGPPRQAEDPWHRRSQDDRQRAGAAARSSVLARYPHVPIRHPG